MLFEEYQDYCNIVVSSYSVAAAVVLLPLVVVPPPSRWWWRSFSSFIIFTDTFNICIIGYCYNMSRLLHYILELLGGGGPLGGDGCSSPPLS